MKIPKFLQEQIDKEEPSVRAAFLEAFDDIRDSIVFDRLVQSIASGNIDQAMVELGIQPEFFDELTEALRRAHRNAGRTALRGVPETVIRFDGQHPRAEAWATAYGSALVTGIVVDQREAVRLVISEGLQAGAGPRQTALNIVGRVNKVTGRREGGILGLTAQQAEYVINARRELTSGNPSDLRNYLNRARRDKRYDAAVRAALRNGTAVDPAKVELMVARYEDRLLLYRGEVIARTETLTALNEGRKEGMIQLIERGGVPRDKVKKIWRSTGDARTRDTHMSMEGQTRDVDQPFETPNGYRLMSPGDKSMGAPPQETIQCRCWVEYKVDYLGQIRG